LEVIERGEGGACEKRERKEKKKKRFRPPHDIDVVVILIISLSQARLDWRPSAPFSLFLSVL